MKAHPRQGDFLGGGAFGRSPDFAGKTSVVMPPDFGERYLSSILLEGIV
jgi:hypothetical protein